MTTQDHTDGAVAVSDIATARTTDVDAPAELATSAPPSLDDGTQPDTPLPVGDTATEGAVESAGDAEDGRHRVARLASGQWGVAAFATVMGCLTWWFAVRHDLPLLYADARSHLSISRRLLDGENASMVQLGTVWLPLPHVLIAPFSLVNVWWRSGFAAFPVNLLALVVEAIALFRIVMHASKSRLGAWAAVLILCTNPGWLYLHTTSLGEAVVFAALLATVAGLSGWVRSDKPYSGGELTVFVGLPAAAAVLSRYDGWAMAIAVGAFVLVVAQLRWKQWRYSLRCLRGYAIAPLVTAVWWCWFNWVNWGDPLEFQRGQYSAQAQQKILDDAGLLPDKGNLGRSIDTYLTATLEGAGRYVVIAAALGAVAWLLVGRWRLRALAPWLLLVVPVGFYVLSLYTGQIALRLGTIDNPSMFNLRYGLQALPGLAVMLGLGAALITRGWAGPSRWWRASIAGVGVAVLLGVTTAAWIQDWRQVPVVAEGLQQRDLGDDAWAAAEYLHANAVDSGGGIISESDNGRILIDDSINPMLPVIAANLDGISAPFSGPRWNRGLRQLDRSEWIFADETNGGDTVAKAIAADPTFGDDFDEVFRQGNVAVYRRVGR